MIQFVGVSPWDDFQEFSDMISHNEVDSNKAHEVLYNILKPLMLRRTKQSKNRQGANILQLPKKQLHDIYFNLHEEDRALYEAMLSQDNRKVENLIAKGKVPIM